MRATLQAYSLWALCFFTSYSLAREVTSMPEQSIRVEVNLVTLRFTVKGGQNRPVNHLREEQFRVIEDGALQKIVFFEPPRNSSGEMRRLRLAFLLDISGSTFATRAEEILAAQTFFENIHDFTEVGVFGFTDKLFVFKDFTTNRDLALKAFSSAQKHLGKTAIYASLSTLLSRIESLAPSDAQNILIVVSDGIDEGYPQVARAIDRARTSNVVIYTILVPSAAQLYIGAAPPGSQANNTPDPHLEREEQAQKEAFSRLSIQTGGEHFSGFKAILDFDQVMAQINDSIFGNLYSIGYYTDDPYKDKGQRNIRVEVDERLVSIATPFENIPERMTAKREFIAALFDNKAVARLPQNLHSTFHEVGAELDLLASRREGGEAGLPFRVKISPFQLRTSQKGDVRTQFGVIGLLLDEQGNEVVRLREIFRVSLNAKDIRDGRGIIYTNKLFAPPGVYDFKLALVEIATWKMTAFDNVVRITSR